MPSFSSPQTCKQIPGLVCFPASPSEEGSGEAVGCVGVLFWFHVPLMPKINFISSAEPD